MSLHLYHVPRADMLECRLEILLVVPYPNKNLHVWICSPRGVSTTTYWQMTHIWWHLWKDYTTWPLAGGSHRLICIKPILSYNTFQNPFIKILFMKGWNNPHTLHTGRYVVSGQNSTKLEQPDSHTFLGAWAWAPLKVATQILKHSETMMRFFRTFHG
jgi:hypothetical protein